jgi:hypothetical protein
MSSTNEHDDDSGPRSELHVVQLWEFKLNKRDAMLVLQALGLRVPLERADEARALGDRLTALRVREMENANNSVAGLRANLEKATGRTVEQILETRP